MKNLTIKLICLVLFYNILITKAQTQNPLDDCIYTGTPPLVLEGYNSGTTAATGQIDFNTTPSAPNLFYRNRIIVGDPNGSTSIGSEPTNLSDLYNSIPFGTKLLPYQRSMFQSYGGVVHDISDGRNAISSLIRLNGLGVSFGTISEARYDQFPDGSGGTIKAAYNFGVHGQHSFSDYAGGTLPGGATDYQTAGGYFINYLADSKAVFGPVLRFHAGVIGAIQNQEGSTSSAGNAAVMAIDDTKGEDLNNNGLNYAGLFSGRGLFTSRVRIGLVGISPASSGVTTALLHIDGTGITDDVTGVVGRNVLRVVGLTDNKEKRVLVLDDEDYVRTQPFISSCTDNSYNLNHINGTKDDLECGRIWDNGTNSSSGQVGINFPTFASINATINYTGTAQDNTGVDIVTTGRFRAMNITPQSTPTPSIVGMDDKNELIKIPFISSCTDNSYNLNHINLAKDGLECGRIWDNGTNSTSGQIGINFPTFASINATVNYSGADQDNTGVDIVTTGRFRAMNITPQSTPTLSIVGMDDKNELIKIPYPSTGSSYITANCTTRNRVPKILANGSPNMTCSQIFDNGTSVGIGTTTGFGYFATPYNVIHPWQPLVPIIGNLKLKVNGVTMSTGYLLASDLRYKKNIKPIVNALDRIKLLNGVTYEWKKDEFKDKDFDASSQIGFIAQEVEKVIPQAVIKDDEGYYAMNYTMLIPVLTEAIKEQQSIIDKQQKAMEDLKTKLSALENNVDRCCLKSIGNVSMDQIPLNKEIKLYQNIPNPFTEVTEIKFYLPETIKQASLIIYDLQGKEILKMDVTERNNASIKINGKELAAGMYIYSLIAENKEIDSKRMILTSK